MRNTTEGTRTPLHLLPLSNRQLQRKFNLLTVKKNNNKKTNLTFETKYRSNLIIARLGPPVMYDVRRQGLA